MRRACDVSAGVRLAAARRTTRCRRSCAARLDCVPAALVHLRFYLAGPIIALASTTTFVLFLRANRRGHLRDFFVTGLAAGILILIRAPFVLVIIGMIVMAWVRFRRSQPLAAVCLIAGLFLAYGPWPVRNYFHLGRPLPFTMEGGKILFQGVYLAADDAQSFVELRKRPEFARMERYARTLPPLEEYSILAATGLCGDPARSVGPARSHRAEDDSLLGRSAELHLDSQMEDSAGSGDHLPLAVIGAWVTRGQIFTQVAVLWVTGLWMFYGIVRCQQRYNFPVLPLLFLLAMLGAVHLWSQWLPATAGRDGMTTR